MKKYICPVCDIDTNLPDVVTLSVGANAYAGDDIEFSVFQI